MNGRRASDRDSIDSPHAHTEWLPGCLIGELAASGCLPPSIGVPIGLRKLPAVIHTHSLGRAARYYAGVSALVSGAERPTFQQLHARVAGTAAALTRHGFGRGDRLALLLPNQSE